MLAAIRQASPERRNFLVRRLKEIEEMRKLRASLEHYIEDLKKERVDIAARARIRAPGTAFSRVTLRIGEVYKILDREVKSVAFCLNREGNQIAQEVLNA